MATCIALLPAIVVTSACSASAQTSDRVFSDLGRYLDAGDSIHVVTKSEGQISGEVAAVTPHSLRVVTVDGATREFGAADVGWIDRVPDPWWDGAVAGAALGYALTFGTAVLFCAADAEGCSDGIFTDPGMHFTALKMAGVTGALFALADFARRDRWLVYGARPGASHGQLRQRVRATSVGDLWSAVRPGDRVSVHRVDGTTIAGRFQSASPRLIRLTVEGRTIDVAAPQAERVTRRTSRLLEGMLIGPAVGAAIGGLRPPQGTSSGEGVVTGALAGWAFGTVIGAALPRHSTVYDARPGHTVTVSPELTRRGYGVAAAVRF